ncbi:MAG: hypothetical protein ACI8XO_000951, partial [Verrucomicrobiales bacterium]
MVKVRDPLTASRHGVELQTEIPHQKLPTGRVNQVTDFAR